ncbi:MAG: biotin/lipoyl-binding protein, partial [Clostridia bacterium]|nr:biotin/lipoyl-binding protein [Clostridia bacterium]
MKKAKMKIIPFIIILAGVCLYFYQTQQVADTAMKYTGNVEGKEINLTTEVAGEITGVQVVEGENISKGDLLFSVDVSDYDIQLQQLKLQQEIATLNYDLLLDGASQEDIDLATSNMNSVSKQLSGAERSYEYAQDNYDDLKVLYASGAVSKTELNQSKLAA